jgi:hypothetical protein
MIAMVGISSQVAFAQDDEKTDTYNEYINNYAGDLAQRKIAVAAGKKFIENYGDDPLNADIIKYLKDAIPGLETWIAKEEKRLAEAKKAAEEKAARQKRLNAFDAAYKADDIAKIYQTGEVILDAEPNLVDVALVLAGVGYDEAIKKNDTYNGMAVKYAEMSIRMLENQSVDTVFGDWGGYDYVFKTKAYPDGRSNALGWMNYYVGYIKGARQKKVDESIPYFFKATKFNSFAATIPDVYTAIGGWYITKINAFTAERQVILEERNAETKVEEPSAEKIAMLDTRIDEKLAMEKAYADRAIDAFSRAYSNVAVADRSKDYGKSLFTKLQSLYGLRYYDNPEMQTDTSINTNISMVKAKSMPDPSSTVQPIEAPKPAVTETDAGTTTTGASRTRTVSNTTSNN